MKENKKGGGISGFPANAPVIKSFYYHIPRKERYGIGKDMRKKCPRTAHAEFVPHSKRPQPVDLVIQADRGRVEKLLPLRHGRMAQSAFTFYRGGALNMAYDLSRTPVSGLNLQICGDAHLSNFGGFATPERNIIFSINDLDETLPAPWEWDVKRLAASFVVASRDNGLDETVASEVARECVRCYRKYMAEYSEMNIMDLWHHSLTAELLLSRIKEQDLIDRITSRLSKERSRSRAEEIFPAISKGAGGMKFIKDELPAIFHWEGHVPGEVEEIVLDAFNLYRKSLVPAYALLLDRYEIKDAAIKVVGIGSVGTLCWVLLLMNGDGEPFFLQAKEARSSVLEAFAGESIFPNHGQRVINGYRLMQPFSDPFLGWTQGRGGRHFFFRQLRDIKISIKVETFKKREMMLFAEWCGQALALSHARSGDAAILSGYMGKSEVFDEAIAQFSVLYADQNEKDHASLVSAIRKGKLEAEFEEE